MKILLAKTAKVLFLFMTFALVVGGSAYFALTLIIKGEETVVVPDITGKDVVYTLEILSDLGLNLKPKGMEFSSLIPKNHITHQEPEPGDEIKKGRDVRVVISKGEKSVVMPDVRARSIQQARIILEENDLTLGIASETYHPHIRKDEVITQYPPSGKMIHRNSEVDLLVSLGERQKAYKMPDLIGLSLDDAILLVERNRFIVGEVTSVLNPNSPKNVIADQKPLAGQKVFEGSTVDLIINRKADAKRPRYVPGATGVKLFVHQFPPGYLKRRIRIRMNCFGMSSDVFDELVDPNTQLWLLVPSTSDTTVFLYEDDELVKSQVFDSW